MKSTKHIGHLRAHLFDQLEYLCDQSKPLDQDRAKMVCETSKQIIESVKVEILFAQVLKGALSVPFIENQDGAGERPSQPTPPSLPHPSDLDDDFPVPRVSVEERTQHALNSGPPADHPWRGLGHRRVHTMGR